MSAIAATIFYTKKGNTDPAYQVQLLQGDRTPISLAGVGTTVQFTMTKRGATVPKISLATCTIDDAALGYVTYQWLLADVDTVGTYDGEFLVTLSGPRIQRVPGFGYNTIVIAERLA